MKNKKISVVVPVYNGEKTLNKCVDSILNQDYKNFELIIVDNKSTDNTKKIIEEYTKKDKRVRYAFENKLSLGAARNKGINSVRCDILAMTDCDCIVPKDWLRKLLEIMLKENEDIVVGFQYDLINNFWSKLVQKADEDYINSVKRGKYLESFDPKNFMAKTKIMKEIMFDSNQTYMEDVDFFIRSKNLTRIRFAPEIQVGHHNKSSLLKVIKVNFTRAYWLFRVYRKNKDKDYMDDMTMFTGVQKSKLFISPILGITLFFRNPPSLALYKLIAGGAWMTGTAWAYIKNNKSLNYD